MNDVIDAVLFDLDGTLLDTAGDLAAACNLVLQKYQQKTVPLVEFRQYVSAGTESMICNSFGISVDDEQFISIREEFLIQYKQCLIEHTRLFPQVDELLDFLDQQQLRWGVVTGKVTSLARPLLDHFGLTERSCCLVGGDTVNPSKPDPAPLLHACHLIASRPANSLYIGDEYTDIMAARAAGMQSIAVTYGYHNKANDPSTWQANYVATSASDILARLRGLLHDG